MRVEKTDLASPTPPVAPEDRQRLVGVDPGRRDMIVAAVHGMEKTIKYIVVREQDPETRIR